MQPVPRSALRLSAFRALTRSGNPSARILEAVALPTGGASIARAAWLRSAARTFLRPSS